MKNSLYINAACNYIKISAVNRACRPHLPLPKTIVTRTTGMSTHDSTFKFCTKCQTETERKKSGACKPCARAYSADYRVKNPEKIKKASSKYYAENTEKILLAGKKNRDENPEREKIRGAKRYLNNSASIKEKVREWAQANPEKVKARAVAWNLKNPEKVKAYAKKTRDKNTSKDARRIYEQNRRARKKGNGGELSKNIAEKLFLSQKGLCACCAKPLGKRFDVDHIVPLILGGANSDENMQLLTPVCNRQKGALHPIDFMQKRGYLL